MRRRQLTFFPHRYLLLKYLADQGLVEEYQLLFQTRHSVQIQNKKIEQSVLEVAIICLMRLEIIDVDYQRFLTDNKPREKETNYVNKFVEEMFLPGQLEKFHNSVADPSYSVLMSR